MAAEPQRTLSSGAGVASTPDRPRGMPATGTPPGAWRGAGAAQPFGATDRKDRWWLIPVVQALGLVILIGYANYAAILGPAHYHYIDNGRDYLSPFYSPYLHPSWLPSWLSPALLILVFPLGFRTTCYYYRKAYYRSFFADPMGCSVGEVRSKGYCGETKFPFILQNLHRYFLYAALVFLIILWWDVVKAFLFRDPATGAPFLGVGGGSLAILASTGTLTLYTFSCHSLRHLIGGKLDCFSCAVAGGPRHKAWGWVSILNEHHMGYAWVSLFAVCFADFYVRMCSMGVFTDPLFMTFKHLFDTPWYQP
jgi:hypothetical protein